MITSFGGAGAGSLSWGVANEVSAGYWADDPGQPCNLSYHPPDPQYEFNSVNGNRFKFYHVGDGASGFDIGYEVSFESAGFSLPLPMKLFADGVTILSARCEVTSSGVTKFETTGTIGYTDCSSVFHPGSSTTDTTVTDVDYDILAFSSATDYEVIGTMEGGKANYKSVVDCKSIIEAMLAHRPTALGSYGYAAVARVPGVIPDGDYKSLFDLVPEPVNVSYCSGDACYPGTYPAYRTHHSVTMQWTSIQFGVLEIRVRDSEENKKRTLVMPRWPAFAEPVPPGMKRYEDGTLAPL